MQEALRFMGKKLQEGTIKMHGLASHFVYVATIVLVYVCVSLFCKCTQHTFLKQNIL